MLITNINDYIDQLIDKHPELTEKQLRYILHFGMISFDNYLRGGFSVKLTSPNVTMWTGGKQTKDSKKGLTEKRRRIRKKARLNYSVDKVKFDGYYYFYLNETLVKKTKPFEKKQIKVKKLIIYKSYEECFLSGTNCYIFRFYYPTDLGFQHMVENEIIRDYEFVGKKENGKLIKEDICQKK